MALSKINTNQIVDGAVATADIADGLITTAKLADNAVTTAKITDGNISTAKLADDAVTTAKVNPAQTDITSVGTLSSLAVTHGLTGSNVATIINTSANSNSNGVLHVKQTGATNQPTMVIEQTGDGGNSGDTQGLHIKMGGQNQGTGKAIRVTTTNANLNSGTAYDAFMVNNGGNLEIKNTSNASTLSLNTSGHLTLPLQPMFRGKDFSAGVATNGTTGYSSTHNHYKPLSVELNIGSHFDNTNGIFTAPTAGIYFCHITWARTSDNWVGVALIKNTSLIRLMWMAVSSRTSASWDTRDMICLVSASANDKLYFTYANGYTAPSNNNNTDMNIFKVA